MKAIEAALPATYSRSQLIRHLLSTARRGSFPLYVSAIVYSVLLVLFTAAALVDDRLVDGYNAWLKPQKFAMATALFTITYAIFLAYLPPTRGNKWLGYGISLCMLVEIPLIGLQAWRGVPSHFNVSTTFDALIFAVMGLAIMVNTILLIIIFIRYCWPVQGLYPTMLLAIRLGMAIFLFGNSVGGYMVSIQSHGSGLIDFRIAHFLGLYAIQIVPAFTWIALQSTQRPKLSTWLFSLIYGGIVVGIFLWMVTSR